MAKAATTRIDGETAFNEARTKARYGHCDWLYWRDRTGVSHAARRSPESIKEMLLEVGTKGNWTIVCANSAVLMKGCWWIGINILAQSRRGWN